MSEFTTSIEIKTPKPIESDYLMDIERELEKTELIGPAIGGNVVANTVSLVAQIEAANPNEALAVTTQLIGTALGLNRSRTAAALVSVECEPYIDLELAELISRAEIARRLKISEARVHVLAQRPDFPQPIQRVDATRPLFRWGDVKEWNERRLKGARPGRSRRERQDDRAYA